MKKHGFTALLALLLLTALPRAFGQTAAAPQQAVPAPAAEEKPKAESVADAQNIDELKRTAPRVFVDGERLDMNFIKEEIQFVNYVRDRTEADVHVLITQQRTGSGGNEYTLKFIGQGLFEDLHNELKFYSNNVNTKDESRKGLVQMLKLGLTPYAARTPICAILQLNLDRKVKTTAVADRWNFWLFSVSANARLNGEKSRTSNSIFGNVSLNRTTPQAKFRLGVSTNIEETRYDYEDYKGVSTSTYALPGRPVRLQPGRSLVRRRLPEPELLDLQQHRLRPQHPPGRRVQRLPLRRVHPPAAPHPLPGRLQPGPSTSKRPSTTRCRTAP